MSNEGDNAIGKGRGNEVPSLNDERLTQSARNFHFAMQSNGYLQLDNGKWGQYFKTITGLLDEYQGQRVSFFGPEPTDKFYSSDPNIANPLASVLNQQNVISAVGKYRDIDEDQARRISFLLGGIARHALSSPSFPSKKIDQAVEFVARMAKLGERKSGDAVTSAMAMYVIDGGPLDVDRLFVGDVYHMAEAVAEDPIDPQETQDLGLSQVMRLRAFENKRRGRNYEPFEDVTKDVEELDGLPTVGAEFHLPLEILRQSPDLWQRLALLNMSQYQQGSYIQLSRNDKGVIEVRMNPSIYPVTVANWNHMRQLIPELNKAFFTITLNRKDVKKDFLWENAHDKALLEKLRALGLLSYANSFEDVHPVKRQEQIDFGTIYLGQTVRVNNGKYGYTGAWKGGLGKEGQLSIYTGFGENFTSLAYYLSMALADQDVLQHDPRKILSRISTLREALELNRSEIREIFMGIQTRVKAERRLNNAFEAGHRIMQRLNPGEVK